MPNLSSPGIDLELIASAQGASLVDVVAGAHAPIDEVGGSVTVDREARSFVVRIPRAALEPAGAWRVRVVSGLADATGSRFEPVPPERGGAPQLPPVYNVGFRSHTQEDVRGRDVVVDALLGTERCGWRCEANWWMDAAQARALALGDVSEFSAEVRWDELAAGTTTPEPRPAGAQNRWYVTSLELGQGIVGPKYAGRIQPYYVYVPTSYDGTEAAPVRFLLHALHTNHNHFGLLAPTLIRDACEEWNAICVGPLGRGPDGWFENEAELDFWEVWGRVADGYRLDPERTSLVGYSMGGYGASRFSHRYPDLFARAVTLAAPVTEVPEVENLRWIPTLVLTPTSDAWVNQTDARVDALDALGYRYRYESYPAEDHIGYSLKDAFAPAAAWLARHTRAVDPGRVSLSWSTPTDRPDLGFAVTGAYWVRDVAVRDPAARARFEATSLARPDREVTAVRSNEVNVTAQPSPATVRALDWELGAAPPPQPRIELQLTNISRAAVDMVRAGVARGTNADLVFVTDGPVGVTLRSLAPGTRALVDGVVVAVAGGQGEATVTVGAGTTELYVRRGRGGD